ncbi:MAG: purine phosphorylase, partial [Stellaceae bacterium]
VADPAELSLPPAALVGIAADGRAALGPVLRSLVAHPGQLPALLRLARHTRLAFRSLARAADAL